VVSANSIASELCEQYTLLMGFEASATMDVALDPRVLGIAH
jgi:hypothetical protein